MVDSADKAQSLTQLDFDTQKFYIAKLAKEKFHIITTQDKSEDVFYFDGSIYRFNGEQKLKEFFHKIIIDPSTGKVAAMIDWVKRESFLMRDLLKDGIKLSEIEKPPNPHLALKNILLNVDTLQTEEFNADLFLLNKLPVNYKPEIDYHTSLFWKFINEILPEKNVLKIQEVVGAILRKEYLTKKFVIFTGPPNTGKTTLLKVIIALIGQSNISSISLQRMAKGDKFTLGPMFGKMANIRDELPKDIVRGFDQLKELTGRSVVQAERKFGAEFEFVNYAFIIFACNFMPPLAEDDDAVYDRMEIVDFTRVFGGREKPDRELESKLTTPEELSAVLNWAIEGLSRLKEQHWNFSTTDTIERKKTEYKHRSKPLDSFVDDCIESSGEEGDFISKDDFFYAFKKYCKELGLEVWTKDRIGKVLVTLDIDVESSRASIDNKVVRVWRKIRFKESIWQNGTPVHANIEHEGPHEESYHVQLSDFATLPLNFTKLTIEDICFGSDCELCGRKSCATFKSSEGRLYCQTCKQQESANNMTKGE
jgi:putative DNA primase/helicase